MTQSVQQYLSISIHTLRMEGDVVKGFEGDNLEISIHTLRMEGDRCKASTTSSKINFNPHPPHGG